MQSLGALSVSNFTGPTIEPLVKIELYYGGSWQTPEGIISYTGAPLLISASTSLGSEDPTLAAVAGSWNAELYNPAAVFHPLNPTETYIDVFEVGRKVKISRGIRVSGTDYYWPVMCGIISKAELPNPTTIKLTGYDNAQFLVDYKLREYVDLNFGGTREFTLLDGSNVVPNGTFDTDVSGWTADNGLVESNANGYSGKCLAVATDPNAVDRIGHQRAKATLTGLVVGGQYAVSFQTKKGSSSWRQVAFVAGTTDDSEDVIYAKFRAADSGWLVCTTKFIATASIVYIALEKSSPEQSSPGTMLFDELTITRVQIREYPMTAVEYPTNPPATGCYLVRQQLAVGPPATYEDFYINEDFTWDRATSTLIFNDDWEMPAASTVFLAYVYEAQAPEDVVFHILANSGLYANYAAAKAAAVYTATGIMIDRVGFEADTTGMEAIRLIAERCNYRFYFRYDGKPVFVPKPAIKSEGAEDLVLEDAHVAEAPEYIRADSELFNRITLTGELLDRESKDDLGDKASLTAMASDAASIIAYGEKNLSITNTFWQTQATIDAAAAAFLADLKTPKQYLRFTLKFRPLPIVWGDTVSVEVMLVYGAGGIVETRRGLARDIKTSGHEETILIEVAAT